MPKVEIDFAAVQKKIPYEKTREAYALRTQFFNKLDKNRNGTLTLEECQKGIEAELQIDAAVDVGAIVKRSFQAAKNWTSDDANHADADTVSRQEFRILLRCVHHYIDLKILFDQIDSMDDDYKITQEEFINGLDKLEKYGIKVEKDKAETTFKQIDGNDAGTDIFFEEFCTWCLKQKASLADAEEAPVLKELTVQNRIMTDFEKWDVNRDGTITRQELSMCFTKLGSQFNGEELDKIMKVADTNEDGKINYREFVGWLFSGNGKPATVSAPFVEAALKERGINNQRVLDGLLVGFDRDEDGDIDAHEFDDMLKQVDEMLLREEEPDDVPSDCKAFIKLADTKHGPFLTEPNPNLKMMLTSAGIMPKSTQDVKDTFNALKAKVKGKGMLYLVDARMVKLQFSELNCNPEKHNKQAHVSYRRTPDEPGGEPKYDADGKLEMKSQKELAEMVSGEGYACLPYNLRNHGHYANGGLEQFCGNEDCPVYVAYLWYIGQMKDGKPDYQIFVGKGEWRGGKYVAFKTDGTEFTEDDYNLNCSTSSAGDHFFKKTDGSEFRELVGSVASIYATGGIPFIPILHFQPYFVNEGEKTKTENPYGKAILDNVKAGNLVYVGMSAGAMAWGSTMGPLTTDPDAFMFHDEADGDMEGVDFGPDTELGKIWLFPGLGKYVGIPHELALKVHVHFSAASCSYGGTAKKAERVSQVISCLSHKDKYCCLLSDYDWDAGQGDVLEVSGGELTYHVGYCERVDEVGKEHVAALKDLGYEETTMPRHPKGNTPEGWSFKWSPNDGEVIAAGPKSKRPFHMYASSDGLCKDAPPTYSG